MSMAAEVQVLSSALPQWKRQGALAAAAQQQLGHTRHIFSLRTNGIMSDLSPASDVFILFFNL
jgi:hypothetical protein